MAVVVLSDSQLDELRSRGITVVRTAISRLEASAIEARVWTFLREREGVDRHDPSTWPATVGKLQPLRTSGAFDEFLNDDVRSIAERLLGDNSWESPVVRPQALLGFPGTGDWVIPHHTWHLDLPARGPTERLSAVRFLGFVNGVGEHGGGTLVVEGSHELVRRLVERAPDNDFGKSSTVRAHLTATSSWFRLLTTDSPGRTDPLMHEGDEIDGVRVKVTELRGNAGDIVVMHPWMLHNIGVNRSRRPRMMMSHTVYAADNPFC